MKKNNRTILSTFSLSLLSSVAFSSNEQFNDEHSVQMQIDVAVNLPNETIAPVNPILIVEPTPQVRAYNYVRNGDLSGLKKLLLTVGESAFDLNTQIEIPISNNSNGAEKATPLKETLLYCACKNGFSDTANYLIYEKKVQTSIYNGLSPLYAAYKNKHYHIVDLLLQAPLNPYFQNIPEAPDSVAPGAQPAAQPNLRIFKSPHIVDEAIYDACVDGKLSVFDEILNSEYGKGRNFDIKVMKIDITTVKNADTHVVKAGIVKAETPFYAACFYGYKEIVKSLIAKGANIETPAKNGWSPIYAASKNGHTEVVKSLIDAVAPKGEEPLIEAKRNFVNFKNKNNMTPLNLATYHGFTDIVRLLLDAGADVNMGDKLGARPLHVCVQNNHSEIMDMLLAVPNINISVQTEAGITAIYVAAFNGNDVLLKNMINKVKEQEKSPYTLEKEQEKLSYTLDYFDEEFNKIRNQPDLARKLERLNESYNKYKNEKKPNHIEAVNLSGDKGLAPLIVAAYNGKLECVELLCENGADIDAVENNKVTALYAAAQNGHFTVVESLANKRASINHKISNQNTPLHSSAIENRVDVAKFLLPRLKKEDINTLNSDHATPLYMASEKGNSEIVQLLFEHKADYSIPNVHGVTSINIAAQNGDDKTVQLHIDAMIQDNKTEIINVASTKGTTPLFIAAQNGHTEIVKKILSVKVDGVRVVDTNFATLEGETALFTASFFGHPIITQLLIDHDALIDKQDNDGRTALWWTVKNNKADIIEILIKASANLNISDREENTALHKACELGHIPVAISLIKNGAKQDLTNSAGQTAYQLLSPEDQITFDEAMAAESTLTES
jgi:ankyrin repeat protein